MSARFVRRFALLVALTLFHPGGASAQDPPGPPRGPLPRRAPASLPGRFRHPTPALAPVARDALTRALRSGHLSEAEYALWRAWSLFHLDEVRRRFGHVARPDPRAATLILRDLAARVGELSVPDRERAMRILARPTDGAADPGGQGYAVPAASRCATNVCVHWVESTEDAPDLTDTDADGIPDRVETTAAVLEEVWAAEVTTLGYRPPKSDLTSPNHGPDGRLDVYLADIGPELYGYCTTDDPNAFDEGYPYWDVSAYCVLDDDHAPDQFPSTSGLEALQVTAAHEFFHAVQFAYDWFEDPWLLEGTAAWIEDEVYDDVDDDLQYLPESPLRRPDVPIDRGRGGFEYGAWIFWRFLSEYFGSGGVRDPSIIRRIWELADGSAAGPDLFSARAAAAAVAEREWQLRWAVADFGVWNVAPSAFYEEGTSYRAAPRDRTHVISGSRPSTGIGSLVLDHLTNRAVGIRRGSGVPRSARLLVAVDMPPYRRGSEASVIVSYRSGALAWFPIRLDRDGDGRRRVDFGRSVREVVLVLTNASSRYRCWMGTTLSCQGRPRDDDLRAWYIAALA